MKALRISLKRKAFIIFGVITMRLYLGLAAAFVGLMIFTQKLITTANDRDWPLLNTYTGINGE